MIGDLARELRFRYVDGPVIESAREPVYVEMERRVAALRAEPERADREDLMAAIVDCPRPLAPLLTQSMAGASPAALAALVEAMTRRYYRVRTFEPFRTELLGGRPFLLGRYVFEGRRAITAPRTSSSRTWPRWPRRSWPTRGRCPRASWRCSISTPRTTPRASRGLDLAEQLHTALRAVEGCTSLHRIVVAVADHERGRGMGAVDLFTFRPGPDGLVEDVLVRGMHPMMGHRLKLWRLAEFELDRLPSAEDVYLFHGVGRSNPGDERLFALAEVRDLTAVRDERGRVVALPELEQALIQVFEAIREFQAHRPLEPPADVEPGRAPRLAGVGAGVRGDRTLIERLVPLSAGLGLELLEINGRIAERAGTGARARAALLRPDGARRRGRGQRSRRPSRSGRSTRAPGG